MGDRLEHGRGVVLLGGGLHQLVEQEAGDADGQQVQHHAEHHLVDQVVDREHRQQGRHGQARERPPPASPPAPTGSRLPATAAANAAARNWPSIDTLTTPARSQSTPHRAPKTSGVASASVPANWLLTGKGRSRPAAAQVRKPMTTAKPATVAASSAHPARASGREEAAAAASGKHRADRHGDRRRAPISAGSCTSSNASDNANRADPRGRGEQDQQHDATTRDQDAGGDPLPPLLRASTTMHVARGIGAGRERVVRLRCAHARPPSAATGPTGRALRSPDERHDPGAPGPGAATNSTISACSTVVRVSGVWAMLCMARPPACSAAEQQPGQHGAERLGPAQQRHGDRVEADGADDARRQRHRHPGRRRAERRLHAGQTGQRAGQHHGDHRRPGRRSSPRWPPRAGWHRPRGWRSRWWTGRGSTRPPTAASREITKPRCSWLPSSRGMVAFQSTIGRDRVGAARALEGRVVSSRPAGRRRCSSS